MALMPIWVHYIKVHIRATWRIRVNHQCGLMSNYFDHLLWPPYGIGQAIIFLPCGFFLLLSLFSRLISAAADWMSTMLLHMVWP